MELQPHQLSQGPPLLGLDLWRGGGEEGALAQGGSPVPSAPTLQGRKEEGSTELGFEYSRSYKIEDKSSTLWGRGAGRNQNQIPPTPPVGARQFQDPEGQRAGLGKGGLGVEEPKDGPTLTWIPGHRASEARGARALGDAWADEDLQLGQVQLQLVGWGAVPKGMRWGRIQGPVWLYHEALVLLQGQGLQGEEEGGREGY